MDKKIVMTSIEKLVKEIEKHDKEFSSFYGAEIEQAKEMHKKEIIDAWDNGNQYEYQKHINAFYMRTPERYYQETFK